MLIQEPPAVVKRGSVFFDGKDLLKLSEEEMYDVRGKRITMIFQDPMTSLNPLFTVESQLTEPLKIHRHMNKEQARARALELLRQIGRAHV